MDQFAEPTAAPSASNKEQLGILSRVARLAALPVAILSGASATYVNIRASTVERAMQLKPFKAISQKFLDAMETDVALREQNTISQEEFAARATANKAAQANEIIGHIDYLGLNGFKTKWRFISRSHRQRAVVEGLTVGGIAIGAMLTIANTKSFGSLILGEPDDQERQA